VYGICVAGGYMILSSYKLWVMGSHSRRRRLFMTGVERIAINAGVARNPISNKEYPQGQRKDDNDKSQKRDYVHYGVCDFYGDGGRIIFDGDGAEFAKGYAAGSPETARATKRRGVDLYQRP
ncbi:MAG: hypothetical protein PF483_11405, partial [Halothiobacillus sp.]|nr:hypothetical protein [Halothiobacillus sp.]